MTTPRKPGDKYGYLRRNRPDAIRGMQRARQQRQPATPSSTRSSS